MRISKSLLKVKILTNIKIRRLENSQFAKAKYEPNPAASGALCKNNANEISNPTSLFWPDALTTDDKLRKKVTHSIEMLPLLPLQLKNA